MKLLRDFHVLYENQKSGAQFDEPSGPYDNLEGDDTISDYINRRIDTLSRISQNIADYVSKKFTTYKVAPPGTFGAPPDNTEIVRIAGQNYNVSAMADDEKKEIKKLYERYGHSQKVLARLQRHRKKYVPSELATAATQRGTRNPEEEKYIMKAPGAALSYAQTVIRGRWPEAEPYIMKNPRTAVDYAIRILKGRWPEAEPIIMKDPGAAYFYSVRILKGRWLEAEPYIMKDPATAVDYAKDVVMTRWIDAEPFIAKEPFAAANYAKVIIKHKWPEGEAAILTNPTAASHYAQYVLRAPWPEAEKIIKTSESAWERYQTNVLSRPPQKPQTSGPKWT